MYYKWGRAEVITFSCVLCFITTDQYYLYENLKKWMALPCFVCVIATITTFCGTLLWTRNIINWGETKHQLRRTHRKQKTASITPAKGFSSVLICTEIIQSCVGGGQSTQHLISEPQGGDVSVTSVTCLIAKHVNTWTFWKQSRDAMKNELPRWELRLAVSGWLAQCGRV